MSHPKPKRNSQAVLRIASAVSSSCDERYSDFYLEEDEVAFSPLFHCDGWREECASLHRSSICSCSRCLLHLKIGVDVAVVCALYDGLSRRTKFATFSNFELGVMHLQSRLERLDSVGVQCITPRAIRPVLGAHHPDHCGLDVVDVFGADVALAQDQSHVEIAR